MPDIDDMNTETKLISDFFDAYGIVEIESGLPVDGHQRKIGQITSGAVI